MNGWTLRSACVIALSAVLASAGRLQGQAQTPEQQVWAAVIQARGNGAAVQDSTGTAWMGGDPRGAPADAWRRFQEVSRQRVSLRDAIGPLHPPAVFAGEAPAAAARSCQGPRTLILSRVGFSADGTFAVVGLGGAVGSAPYPGCGYAWGDIMLLHRDDEGTWRIVRMLGGWMS